MLFQYHLPGYTPKPGHLPVMHKRHTDAASLGVKRTSTAELSADLTTCGGSRHSLPYAGNFKEYCLPGYGWKFERLAACGHPARSGQFVEDTLRIHDAAFQYMSSNGKAVMEYEIHNSQTGYTFENGRLIIETRTFDDCFEPMHLDAYCQ